MANDENFRANDPKKKAIANGSCPGPYKSVSYTLRSQVVEACFFVSTDYIRWADGRGFCGRLNNGSLAEFHSNRKLQAFRNFLSTMPDTTKDELWDAEHAWIGGAVLDRSVWRWHSSGRELESSISEALPINDFYGLTINVHSKELVPFKLQSLSLSPGKRGFEHSLLSNAFTSYEPNVYGQTEQTGSSVPQTVARDSSECQAELKRTQEELAEVQVQLLVADCPCSTRSVLEAEAGVKEERISALERELREEKRLSATKDAKISALEEKLESQRTSAVMLLAKDGVPKIPSAYEDEESFRLEVRLLEAVATDVKGNTEKNGMTIKARFANVSAMEVNDRVFSEPHYLRGFGVRLLARRRTASLGLSLSCIGNVLEGDYSVSVTFTLTLERDGGKGGPETLSFTTTYDQRITEWGWHSFLKWEELVAPGSGWIGEDGTVRVSSTVKINE
ncbi:unnamed protein product [Cyprideis torosa]|uniref:Uncharacterized protein n=1 Tax=Cyprideis torosa TaxID=163714 RepID=A0A7R8ZNH3_9CRUS|nr:unnamed protein product [Cyprideis torosa]CAG0898015.1 unnamed protein product [Cyprideis torosa]